MIDTSNKKEDFILKYGKYAGKSIYKIKDKKYIKWLIENIEDDNLNKSYYNKVIQIYKDITNK